MLSDSVKKFSDQVLNDPSSLLFASLADFYRENGLYQEALNICQNGLESHPESTDGRLVLAQCCRALGEIERARAELTRVLSAQPENAMAKKLLAELEKGASAAAPAGPAPAAEEVPEPDGYLPPASVGVQATAAPAPEPQPPAAPAEAADQAETAPPPPELPENFHQGARAMMALAAESAGRAESGEPQVLEYQEPSASSEPGPEEAAAQLPPPVQEKPVPSSEESGAYGRILDEITRTSQVYSALLADESGYPVASSLAPGAKPIDEESAGALASLVFSIASQAMQKVKLGTLERAVIDTKDDKIFLSRAGSQVLSVAADSSAKVGLVAVNVKRAVERLNNLSQQ